MSGRIEGRMMTNLKPCPFCGQNFLVKILGNTDEVKRIYCKTCDFDVSNSRWNERKIPEKSIEVFKEMVEALKTIKGFFKKGTAIYETAEEALTRAKKVGVL